MKKPRLLFWGGFGGVIVAALGVVLFAAFHDASTMRDLAEFYADWRVAQGTVAPFTARFPKEPEHAVENLPISGEERAIQQELYVSGSDGRAYFVSALLYPKDFSDGEEDTLRSALGGMVQTVPEADVLAADYIVPFWGSNYLAFEFRNPADGIHYRGRIYRKGQSLYQIYSSYQLAVVNDNEYAYFVGSFALE